MDSSLITVIDAGVWRLLQISDEEYSSYLLIAGNRSLLFEGAGGGIVEICRAQQTSTPDMILHTLVKPGLCRSDYAAPGSVSYVPAGYLYAATQQACYQPHDPTPQEHLADWGDKRGEEAYGVMGSRIWPFLTPPLTDVLPLKDADVLEWAGFRISVVPTPGHGKFAVSLLLHEPNGRLAAVFCGGLVLRGGLLPNLYDSEWNYGLYSGLLTLCDSLDKLQELVSLETGFSLCPAYGPPVLDTDLPFDLLRERLKRLLSHQNTPISTQPLKFPRRTPVCENWADYGNGIYGMTNGGNALLFMQNDGDALMVDPGPCYYENGPDEYRALFNRDLQHLERICGVRSISDALVTHMHGDHVDAIPLLQERYGTRVHAPEIVARVITAPDAWNYPALAPAYDYGVHSIEVHEVLSLDAPFTWHGCAITPFFLPGHCLAHVGYALAWHGRRIALTGDFCFAFQQLEANVLVLSNHTDEGDEGYPRGLRNLCAQAPDLLFTGHSGSFYWNSGLADDFAKWLSERRSLLQATAGSKSLHEFLIPPLIRDGSSI